MAKAFFLIFLVVATACAPQKKGNYFRGPGHDADWPIDAPNSDQYSEFAKAQRLSFYGKIDQAIEAYQEALKLDPTSGEIPEALAFEFMRKGDLKQSEQMVRRALSVRPKSRNAYLLLGKVYSAQQKWKEGEEAFKKAIELDTDEDEEPVLSLASLYVDSKQYDQAVKTLNEFLEKNPNSLFGFYYLGRVYTELKKPDEALEAYEKAIALNPGFTAAIKAMALLYESLGKKDKAKKAFEQVLEQQPDNLGVRNHLSQLYLDDKDYDAALRELEIVVQDQPDNLTARLRLGLLYLQKNDLVRSEKLLRDLLKDAPQKDRVQYYLGLVLQKKGDSSGALKNFEAVGSESDLYEEARLSMAFIYEDKGATQKAVETLRAATKRQPESPELYGALSNLLTKLGKGNEAVELLENQLKSDKFKKEETLWFALGEVYDKLKNMAKLEESMRKVLEINPDNAAALNYLGYTFAEKGIKLEEAEHLLKRALEIKPKDGYITDSLGWLYYRKGDLTKALKTLEEAMTLSPNESVIMEHYADVLVALGGKDRKRKAKQVYEKALKFSKDEKERQRIRDKARKS
jgi:tetratricopeptide (TPR) repeat protein